MASSCQIRKFLPQRFRGRAHAYSTFCQVVSVTTSSPVVAALKGAALLVNWVPLTVIVVDRCVPFHDWIAELSTVTMSLSPLTGMCRCRPSWS